MPTVNIPVKVVKQKFGNDLCNKKNKIQYY